MSFVAILVKLLFFVISSIPLYFAVKFFGGKTTLIKTAGVVFIGGIIVGFVESIINIWGGIVAFVLMLAAYSIFFEMTWFKAFFAWLLQFVFLILFYIILMILFSASLATYLLF